MPKIPKVKALPLPEGLTVGDTVYFKGPSQQWEPAGHSLVHGCVGKVAGPAVPGVSIWSSTLATPVTPQLSASIQFTGNPGPVNIHAQELSPAPLPDLPGGWKVGDKVWYSGPSYAFASGNRVWYGGRGEVVGPATSASTERLAIDFPGSRGRVGCRLVYLSKNPPPPLPGGFAVNEVAFYTGPSTCPSEVLANGDRYVHGAQCEVQGPTEDAFGDWLSVKFKENKDNMDCAISDLSRAPPRALPGGFALGEMVFFVGSTQRQSSVDDEHATYGGRGEVMGPSDDKADELSMLFRGNKSAVGCHPSELSRIAPQMAAPGPIMAGATTEDNAIRMVAQHHEDPHMQRRVVSMNRDAASRMNLGPNAPPGLAAEVMATIKTELRSAAVDRHVDNSPGAAIAAIAMAAAKRLEYEAERMARGGASNLSEAERAEILAGGISAYDHAHDVVARVEREAQRMALDTAGSSSRLMSHEPPPWDGRTDGRARDEHLTPEQRLASEALTSALADLTPEQRKALPMGLGTSMPSPMEVAGARAEIARRKDKALADNTSEQRFERERERLATEAAARRVCEASEAALEAAMEAGDLEALREAIDRADAAKVAPELLKRARGRRDALRKGARKKGKSAKERQELQERQAAEAEAAAKAKAAAAAAKATEDRAAREEVAALQTRAAGAAARELRAAQAARAEAARREIVAQEQRAAEVARREAARRLPDAEREGRSADAAAERAAAEERRLQEEREAAARGAVAAAREEAAARLAEEEREAEVRSVQAVREAAAWARAVEAQAAEARAADVVSEVAMREAVFEEAWAGTDAAQLAAEEASEAAIEP